MSKKVLVSGIQASGRIHIGNYFGAMKQNIELSNSGDFESFIFIADYHSMTSLTDASERRKSSFDLACAYLACGLNTTNIVLFKQSDVPEHTELSWILSTVTPISMLELAHAYKDKNRRFDIFVDNIKISEGHIKENGKLEFPFTSGYVKTLGEGHHLTCKDSRGELLDVGGFLIEIDEETDISATIKGVTEKTINNAGLFSYPVLMAADILMYQANLVPVGKDQAQHIEMTREMAGKFNRSYGKDFFTMPQAFIKKEVEIVPGVDGEKMSKSKGNVIPLFGTDEEIKKAVMGIVTDSARPEDKKDPDTNNIYNIHKLFLEGDELATLRARYENSGLGYKEAKELLLASILSFITPKREEYDYYQNNPGEVEKILAEGGAKAKARAEETMKKVRQIVGLN